MFTGNKVRYINHASFDFENCTVRMITSNGVKHILFYARKKINGGEELFFDYGDDFTLAWKADFNNCAKWFKDAQKDFKDHKKAEALRQKESELLDQAFNNISINKKQLSKKNVKPRNR